MMQRMSDVSPIIQVLKDEMERRELSVQQLAKLAGLSYVNLYAVFAGESSPKLKTIEKLAKVLKIRVMAA